MELFETNHVVCQSAQSEKKIFAYGQKEPIDVAGTFTTDIVCEANGEMCVDEFTVIKGEPLKCTKSPPGPWQDVAVDLMGPMPTGESLLVVVDYYSRYYEFVIMHSFNHHREDC